MNKVFLEGLKAAKIFKGGQTAIEPNILMLIYFTSNCSIVDGISKISHFIWKNLNSLYLGNTSIFKAQNFANAFLFNIKGQKISGSNLANWSPSPSCDAFNDCANACAFR